MRLGGKVALVTGSGGGGIGAATAKTFAREGASVMVVDLNEAGGTRVVDDIRAAGGVADFCRADVGDRGGIEGMIQSAIDRHGRLDILHNNAVFTAVGRMGEIEWDDWQKTFEVGLTGYWWAVRTALPYMMSQGSGVILNTASMSGLLGDYGLGAYNAMKAGVINMTRVIAIEYARKGIRANAICPGPILLDEFRVAYPERFRRIADAIPMGRVGTPQEIANVALFLASDEASFVTGAELVIDGGFIAQ